MTLLTYNSKYVLTSANAVTTTSTSLVDDTEATKTFSLSATQVVLAIYSANSVNGATMASVGMENAISVDSVDKALSCDSEGSTNIPVRNCPFWIGSLGSGSHTIKGRFASRNGLTVTVSNRTLLIYIFNGTEFQYVDDATQQSTSSVSFVDDPSASVTFTPTGSCVLLALYNPMNLGATEENDGKAVAISIAGSDYAQAEKSPGSSNYADSVFTVHCLSRTAISTTVKGRYFANNGGTVTIDRRQLGVLLIDNSVPFDIVTSTSQVTNSTGTLADDTQCTISRTPTTPTELLVIAMGTKRYNASYSTQHGIRYGIKVDTNDRTNSCGAPGAGRTMSGNSAATAWAETVSAAAHTVKGRFSNNYGSETAYVDARQVVALWFPSTIQAYDTGAGSDANSLSATISPADSGSGAEGTPGIGFSVPDAGSGAETVPTLQASFTAKDSGSGSEGSIAITFSISDSGSATSEVASYTSTGNVAAYDTGVGNDSSISILATQTFSDSGAASDSWTVSCSFGVAETLTGSDAIVSTASFTMSDLGSGVEATGLSVTLSVSDSGSGADVIASLSISFTLTDSGTFTDIVTASMSVTLSEALSSLEAIGLDVSFTKADAAAGVDVTDISVSFTVADSGALSLETWTLLGQPRITDSGITYELFSKNFGVLEEVLGAEFAWRLKGSILIDSFELPHVLSITIPDEATMNTRLVQGGSLPLQRMLGKPGRVVTITGWTDLQSDIDSMEALADGTRRTFIHPSGDSFAVLVTDFQPESKVDEYGRRSYSLTLKETR